MQSLDKPAKTEHLKPMVPMDPSFSPPLLGRSPSPKTKTAENPHTPQKKVTTRRALDRRKRRKPRSEGACGDGHLGSQPLRDERHRHGDEGRGHRRPPIRPVRGVDAIEKKNGGSRKGRLGWSVLGVGTCCWWVLRGIQKKSQAILGEGGGANQRHAHLCFIALSSYVYHKTQGSLVPKKPGLAGLAFDPP